MNKMAEISTVPPEGRRAAFDVLTIRLPCSTHVHVAHQGIGEIAVHIFSPTPELLAAVHAATAPFCVDGKCPCYLAGEESEREPV